MIICIQVLTAAQEQLYAHCVQLAPSVWIHLRLHNLVLLGTTAPEGWSVINFFGPLLVHSTTTYESTFICY